MEFLKKVLGEELYGQVEKSVNVYNSNTENEEKQVNIL